MPGVEPPSELSAFGRLEMDRSSPRPIDPRGRVQALVDHLGQIVDRVRFHDDLPRADRLRALRVFGSNVARGQDLGQTFVCRVIGRDLQQAEIDVALDRRQHVIKVVRDAGRQGAQRLQALGVMELLLQAPPVFGFALARRDVADGPLRTSSPCAGPLRNARLS
jgi:hypothetical protein